MGQKRTLRRQMTNGIKPRSERKRGHSVTEKRGTPMRRSTPELKGTKMFLTRIGVPERMLRGLRDDKTYCARLHFTKGWRITA